jgi:Flp pilus assembly protein TadG
MQFRNLPRAFALTGLSRPSLRGFAGAVAGASAVEFAFVAPLAIYLFMGAVDYGLGFYRKMEVNQAAQVGAEYAVAQGFLPDAPSTDPRSPAAISNAVVNATLFQGVAASPAPNSYCGCASASGVVTATCGTNCDDGTVAGVYLTVSASGKYSTLLPYPFIPNSFSLNGAATVRIQ